MFRKLFGEKRARRVELVPSGIAFDVGKSQTVLESALEHGIAFPHDCTVGTCGSCRSLLMEGRVDAITPFGYTLSREELDAGYILACQAVPKTDVRLAVGLEPGQDEVLSATGRIVEMQTLTHDILKVTWLVDQPLSYRAGQYMNVSWEGRLGHRSYSFCNAPVAPGTQRVSAFVRHVPGGAFTDPLFAGAFASQVFTIDAPHGNFWLRDGNGPMLLVGGGSGLSPLMAMLEDALVRGVSRDVVLAFGGRGQRDLYCQDEIQSIAARWKGRFAFWPVLSEEDVPGMRHGMVTGIIPQALEWLGTGQESETYLCGPPPMIDAALAGLSNAGIPLDRIFYDKFTDSSSQ